MPKEIKKDEQEMPGGQEELETLGEFLDELKRQIEAEKRKKKKASKDGNASEE